MSGSMRSLILPVVLVAGVALLGALVMVFVIRPGVEQGEVVAPRSDDVQPQTEVVIERGLYSDFFIPEFELADQDGEAVDESILEGEYTVVDFFFTTCPLACPGMNAQMQRVQEATEGTSVRLLGISVSGDYDTPEILRAYAGRLAADPERWRLLTGEPAYVASLVRDGLKFEVAPDDSFEIELPDGSTMFNVQHPTKLLLIGPDRHVVAMADYLSPEQVTALIARARALAGG